MATEHTKHQVKSKECQDVVKDLFRVISLVCYYWRDLIIITIFTMMTDLLFLSYSLYVCTCTIVLMKYTHALPLLLVPNRSSQKHVTAS